MSARPPARPPARSLDRRLPKVKCPNMQEPLASLASRRRANGWTDTEGEKEREASGRERAPSPLCTGWGGQRDGRECPRACVCVCLASAIGSPMRSRSRRRATLSLSLGLFVSPARSRSFVRASNSDGAKKNEERNPAERVELSEQRNSWFLGPPRGGCAHACREREKTVNAGEKGMRSSPS